MHIKYLTVVFLVSTACALPMGMNSSFQLLDPSAESQTDIYPRHAPGEHLDAVKQKTIPKHVEANVKTPPSHAEAVESKSAPAGGGASKSPLDQTKDMGRSTVIITFWNAERYRQYQADGGYLMHNVVIHDTPCTTTQTDALRPAIQSFIKTASKPESLLLKPGPPMFDFRGLCQTQWLPLYTNFDVRVLNGEPGGKCESGECHGMCYVESGRGKMWRDHGDPAFYDDSSTQDRNLLQAHHNDLRPAPASPVK